MNSEKYNEAQAMVNATYREIVSLKSDAAIEKNQRTGKLTQKLVDEIALIKSIVNDQVDNKYRPLIESKEQAMKAYKAEVERLRAECSKAFWLPEGTKVAEHKYSGIYRQLKPTGKIGVVAIYDGTQQLSNRSRSWPPIGSKIVIILKKDGSPSTHYESIYEGPHYLDSSRANNWKQIENEKQ